MTDHDRPDQPEPADGPGAREFSPDQELEEMLRDAEETVARLRAELAVRRERARVAATEAEQHEEIARLAEHLADAKVHWGAVREFFEQALREFAESRRRREEGT